MTILIFWLLCGVVSAFAASSKGRSGVGYFVLGVLLGPFGFIVALLAKPNEPELRQQAVASGEMKTCPFCAEVIRREAVKCRFCAETLPLEPVSSLGAPLALDSTSHDAAAADLIPPDPSWSTTGVTPKELALVGGVILVAGVAIAVFVASAAAAP